MRMNAPLKSARRSTNVSLAADLVAEAKALDINLSRACEAGLEVALKQERKRRWQEENRAAAEASNAWVEKHGLPLARYRQF
jgi:antitoxin CcdA